MLLFLGLLAASSGVRVSIASIDITPPESLPLGGYTERKGALSVPGDRLLARAIMLSWRGMRIALVGVETLTIPQSLVSAVQDRLAREIHVFMAATHTHCAPDSALVNSQMDFSVPGIASFKRKWLKWYADKIAQCIHEASRARPFSRTLSLFSKRIDANVNRRGGKEPDKQAHRLVLETDRASKDLFVHYAAHPTLYPASEHHLRGDWPGKVMEKTGGLVLLGPIGDVSPKASGNTPAEQVSNLADLLTKNWVRATHAPEVNGRLAWAEQAISLPVPEPHPQFADQFHVVPALASIAVTKFAPTSAKVCVCRIGPATLIGIPGEPSTEVASQIVHYARALGIANPLVVSHVNGWIGYILSREDYAKGGYEATLSFYGPGLSSRVVQAAKEALTSLNDRSGS